MVDKSDLTEIQKQIHNWRSNKKYNNIAIPIEIQKAISSLIGRYSGSLIRKTLGLSGSQYKKLATNKSPNDHCKKLKLIKPTFKKVILSPAPTIYQLIIENQNGCKLTFQLPSINELTAIITNFIGGNQSASIS